MWHSSREKMNRHLFRTNTEQITDWSKETRKVQLCEWLRFIGVAYKAMGKELLRRAGIS